MNFLKLTQLEEEQNASIQLKNQKNVLEYKLTNSTNKVKITDFKLNRTTPAVVVYISDFIVTAENYGVNDVENLTVFFNILGYKSHTDEVYNESINIGTLKAGESKTVSKRVQHDYYTNPIVAKLMINDTILDKRAFAYR